MNLNSFNRTLCLLVLFGLLALSRKFQASVRGFWCNDVSIRYPHMDMIVDYRFLLAVSIFIPILFFKYFPNKQQDVRAPVFDYLFGFLVNLILTSFSKIVVSRPRPNFYEICQPSVKCSVQEARFVENFQCTTPYFLAHNSLESFFSGHSSTGTYASFAMMIHLLKVSKQSYSINALISFALLLIGLFPGYTQYLNYWHHWSDVLVGQLVGIALAVAQDQMYKWFQSPHQTLKRI